jgi:ATP-binding cassette subfamily B protein
MEKILPKTLAAFFWHFVKPYKWHMATLFLTGLFWGVQQSLTPYLLKKIIDNLSSFRGDKAQILSVVAIPALAYIILWMLMALNFRFTDWLMLKFFPAIRRDIINAMFSYLGRHSHSYMQNNFAGSLSNKIGDMAGSAASVLRKMDEGCANISAFIIALISMFLVSPVFSGILFLWAVFFVSVTFYFSKNISLLSESFSASKSVLSGKIVDAVTNLSNMRLFARNKYENSRLDSAVTETVDKDRSMQWYILKMRIFWDISFISLLGSMLGALIFLYSKDKITVGDFAFIITLSVNIFMHMWNLANQFIQLAEDLGKCSQALTIVTAPHEIIDKLDAKKLNVTEGCIEFDNVAFHYNSGINVFENKDVIIEAGQKVGLIGFSGSGKTTFVNLILRFFDVESGRIIIDGQNIAEVTQDSLHENISMIPQDTSLFHRSLMEHIRYGRIDAIDNDVIEASKQAHCHEFIESLPEGYESLVGERGIKLSGGQRQRIAIARAMLKNAPILILDEATSALDSITEKHIQEGLKTLMHGRTTIVIAHRLSTLSEMDRILVFDKGHIIEDGTHMQLLNIKGHYARMWNMQAGGFLPEVEGK